MSLIYGFNFQPYGPHMPLGFTLWGHLFNGSAAAIILFSVFRVYDYGKRKGIPYLQVLPLCTFFVIGALIPYMNDASHLTKHGQASTIPFYVVANDLYVFWWGLLAYKVATTNKKKVAVLTVLCCLFLIVHYFFYVPRFPEFYWS
ncbi:hypothetical protein KEJ18_06155 [Candidatus Bathyarchaeota archaeon]|nr:hypothetical protein [Candidatus Bathyarchaeota archaeon]